MSDLSNNLEDYDYQLPQELIAQSPAAQREDSRLLLIRKNPSKGLPIFEDALFKELPQIVEENPELKKALWVRNKSFVIPARFYVTRPTGSRHEIVLVHPLEKAGHWKALIRGQAKFQYPQELTIEGSHEKVIAPEAETIFFPEHNERQLLQEYGEMPLPPYITQREATRDKERYQSIWANPEKAHSVAAPTASLHFSDDILQSLNDQKIKFANIYLHVGLGTFQPLRENSIDKNQLHQEFYEVDAENLKTIKDNKNQSYLCIGSTSLRCLESLDLETQANSIQSSTDIFIKPGYQFKYCNHLLTNFHLPKSSLLVLMSVFAGSRKLVLEAYQHAVQQKYRFFSYGDASLWI